MNKDIPDIPENYFEKMKENLFDKLSEEEQFNWNEFPNLQAISKYEDFVVPNNYFDNLKPKLSQKPRASVFRKMISIAAFGLFVISAVYFFLDKPEDQIDLASMNQSEDYLAYYENNLDEFEFYELSDFEWVEQENDFEGIDDETLVQYLIEEADDHDLDFLL